MIARLLGRCGYRGTWLVIMGTFWLLFGVGTFLTPVDAHPWVLLDYVPAVWQAALWWATGLTATIVGARGLHDDTTGHVALYLMPICKVVSFLVSAFVYAATSLLAVVDHSVQVSGWAASWYAAAVWALVSVMLGLGAAWPNPTPPLPEPPPTAGDGSE